MKELLKERESIKVEEWIDTVVVGVRSNRWQPVGLEAPKRRVISLCSKPEFYKEIRRKIRDPLAKFWRRRRKESVESAETQDYVSALPADELHGTEMGAEDEKDMEGLKLCPECSQRATLGLEHV